jgi:uncharacterized repeat protein (TIGR02543 family)
MKQGARKKLSLLTFILLLSTVTFFVSADGCDTCVFGMTKVSAYSVAFVESGLASGTSWSVTFDGATQASTSTSISFSALNGVYSYSVSVPSGYTSPSTLSGTVTVNDASVIINIVFTPIQPPSYALTMLVVGEGTVSPGNGTYVQGTTVFLEAIGADGWTFNGWSGDASGTGNTTIVMDSSKTVTATFTQNEYNLTMLVAGEGTVSPGNGTYLSGATVSLEAIASDDWGFSEWSGDASGTENTTIVMDGDKVVTATFTNVVIPEFQSPILLLIILIAISATVTLFGGKQLNVPSANPQKREKHT